LNEFFITVFLAYLYSIFLLNLRMKLEAKKIRLFKSLSIVLIAVSVASFIRTLPSIQGLLLSVEILALVMLFVLLVTTFYHEIKSIFSLFNLSKNDKQIQLTNNELATALAESVHFLSRRKIGALITVERQMSLSSIIDNALDINADVSKELITSIFMPTTPLHDGAVIIRNNKILCAKAYFPASERTDLPMNYGTRHRAALGISEQSDAFTIVVSEETGRVSVTVDGKMEYNVTQEGLNLYLENILKMNK